MENVILSIVLLLYVLLVSVKRTVGSLFAFVLILCEGIWRTLPVKHLGRTVQIRASIRVKFLNKTDFFFHSRLVRSGRSTPFFEYHTSAVIRLSIEPSRFLFRKISGNNCKPKKRQHFTNHIPVYFVYFIYRQFLITTFFVNESDLNSKIPTSIIYAKKANQILLWHKFSKPCMAAFLHMSKSTLNIEKKKLLSVLENKGLTLPYTH